MGDPITIAGLGATIAGGATSAIGAISGGSAQKAMYQYQAGVAKLNSQIDLQNRDYAIQQGGVQERQYGMKEAQTVGQIVVNEAASGVDTRSGSAAAVVSSERAIGALDTAQIRANAAKTAYDYSVRSTMDINQAQLDITAGDNAQTAGTISAVSSILGSVSSVSSKWTAASQKGLV